MIVRDSQIADLKLFVGRYLTVVLCQDLADQIMQIAGIGCRSEDSIIQNRQQTFTFDLLLCIENDRYRIHPSGEERRGV